MDTSDSTTILVLKTCSRRDKCVHPQGCIQSATPEHFSRDKNRKDGLHPQCKACVQARWATNKDQYATYQQKYRDNHREHARQLTREWREVNRDRDRENAKRWREQNREQFDNYRQSPEYKAIDRAIASRRRARKRSLPDTFTVEEWHRAIEYFGGCCAVCGQPLFGLFHTAAMDHWIPLTAPDCPGTIASNIVPLCDSSKDGRNTCNESKHNHYPADWLTERYGKRKARDILARIEAYFEFVKTQESTV